jgi:hypothetical protein
MTMEQLAIMEMLAKEGVKLNPRDALELSLQKFTEALRSFAWGDPPGSISPRLVAWDGTYGYIFDLYNFGPYRVGIYYSNGGSPTLVFIEGDGGNFILLRKNEETI